MHSQPQQVVFPWRLKFSSTHLKKSNDQLGFGKFGVLVNMDPRLGQLLFLLRGTVWCALLLGRILSRFQYKGGFEFKICHYLVVGNNSMDQKRGLGVRDGSIFFWQKDMVDGQQWVA